MTSEYTGQAIGVFEMDSYLSCIVALDAAAKAANVKIQGVERNRLKQGACVKMRGSVSDVNAAMEAAILTAEKMGSEVFHHTVIAAPSEETEVAIVMTINK